MVALLTLVGALIRIKTAGSSLVGDELSTLWIVDGRSLEQVIEIVNSDAEITPPFYFVLAWLASKLGSDPELIRLPALIAGISAIPLTYAIGTRMIGRFGALVATAVMTLSPFMVFYSANARAYPVAIVMVMVSTLGLLLATETGRKRWWVLYGAGSCLALYSHYTMAFVLVGQLLWLLWAFPAARKAAIVTNLAAAVFYLPWVGGFLADNNSFTVPILEGLQGTGFGAKRDALEQIIFFRFDLSGSELAGRLDVALIGIGLVTLTGLALAGYLIRRLRPQLPANFDRGLVLALVLTLSTAIGEGLLLLVGTDIFGARNLAAMWVGLPFLIGALAAMSGTAWALASVAVLLVGLGIGATRASDSTRASIPYKEVTRYLEETGGPRVTVVDVAHLTPSPLGDIEAYLPSTAKVFTPGLPEDRIDFIKTIFNVPDAQTELDRAFEGPGQVQVATFVDPELDLEENQVRARNGDLLDVPDGWSATSEKTFSGIVDVTVTTYERNEGKR